MTENKGGRNLKKVGFISFSLIPFFKIRYPQHIPDKFLSGLLSKL